MTTNTMQKSSEQDMKAKMDDMYRWTRHIYDITRKYYLLGRDELVNKLNANDDDVVCEVGCGTARNLVKIAKRYPNARFYGLDASEEMLKTARSNVDYANLKSEISLKQGFSQSFNPKTMFGLDQAVDKFVFSYALSIIPPWQESIDHAYDLLESGGEMHVVDFGGQKRLPRLFRAFVFWWLKMFHVYYKPDILRYFKKMEKDGKGTLELHHLYRGYAYHAVFKKV